MMSCNPFEDSENYSYYQALELRPNLGSAITNGREPSSCLGRVFNFKLGSFVSKKYNCMAWTYSHY